MNVILLSHQAFRILMTLCNLHFRINQTYVIVGTVLWMDICLLQSVGNYNRLIKLNESTESLDSLGGTILPS